MAATLPSLAATRAPEHPREVITTKDRRFQFFKHMIVVSISIATVVLTCWDVTQTVDIYRMKHELSNKIQSSIDLSSLIHNLQKERGLTALLLGLETLNTENQTERLKKVRSETDENIIFLKKKGNADSKSVNVYTLLSFSEPLQKFRSEIDHYKEKKIGIFNQLRTYTNWIGTLISWLPQYTESENLETYANLVFAYQMIIQSKEEAGLERAVGVLHFIRGKNFSSLNSSWYNEKRILAKSYLSTAFSFSKQIKSSFESAKKKENGNAWMKEMEKKRSIISSRNITNPSKESAREWFDLMTKYNDLMLELQLTDASLIQDRVDNDINAITKWLVLRAMLLCFTLVVVPCIIISLVRVQNAFYRYTLSLFNKVGLEQARTDFIMQENSRYVDDLSDRWRKFSKPTNETPRKKSQVQDGPTFQEESNTAATSQQNCSDMPAS